MSDTDSAEFAVGDIAQQAHISETDRLYDNLDYNVGFFSTLEKAITF
jgi:hypothetical protein